MNTNKTPQCEMCESREATCEMDSAITRGNGHTDYVGLFLCDVCGNNLKSKVLVNGERVPIEYVIGSK